MPSTPPQPPGSDRWQRFRSASVRGFHTYANWLVSISWRRFALLSLALLVATAIVQDLPPFRWSYTERVTVPRVVTDPEEPEPPKRPARPPKSPGVTIEKPKGSGTTEGVDISIDESGVRITPKRREAASTPAPGASGAAGAAASATSPGTAGVDSDKPVIDIRLPPGEHSENVREIVAEARRVAEESIREAANEARESAEEAAREAAAAAEEAAGDARAARRQRVVYEPQERVRVVRLGDSLMELAFLWILGSGVIKFTYKRQIQAEAQAAQAVETAEAEALKRQVVEARMAAMQAQVEPHFLFNTLANVRSLIDCDAPAAGELLDAFTDHLRASLSLMRADSVPLAQELDMVSHYLKLMQLRMCERLRFRIEADDAARQVRVPPLLLQPLVE
ncbi:MAG: histidine kinase, partial [Aquabacterium sp.]|nr:histidine kinase [Aquabacterium sp.]